MISFCPGCILLSLVSPMMTVSVLVPDMLGFPESLITIGIRYSFCFSRSKDRREVTTAIPSPLAPSAMIILLHVKFNQWNSAFATSSNLIIPISLQHDGVNLWYFKLRLFDPIWNNNGVKHRVAKIKNQSLWQKISSFHNWLKFYMFSITTLHTLDLYLTCFLS